MAKFNIYYELRALLAKARIEARALERNVVFVTSNEKKKKVRYKEIFCLFALAPAQYPNFHCRRLLLSQGRGRRATRRAGNVCFEI
ncbi:hypothetical protein TNCV_3023941 [Trichonephila clavipes]|nr:hypothetical protein TNCV_3023941 [Trichonephila clavipes]